MSATNGIGQEVQAYDQQAGWKRASKVFRTIEHARNRMEKMTREELEKSPETHVQLRVYESLSGS